MWDGSKHSDQENLRWAQLRALEWLEWPLFLSQPIVPVLFYFYPWQVILISVFVLALLWRFVVVPFWISPGLATLGAYFVKLKFITAPCMAYLLWSQGNTPLALAALAWPLLGPVAGFVTLIPQVILESMGLGKASKVDLLQKRFLAAIGMDLNSSLSID